MRTGPAIATNPVSASHFGDCDPHFAFNIEAYIIHFGNLEGNSLSSCRPGSFNTTNGKWSRTWGHVVSLSDHGLHDVAQG